MWVNEEQLKSLPNQDLDPGYNEYPLFKQSADDQCYEPV